jgi:hypothetical protein
MDYSKLIEKTFDRLEDVSILFPYEEASCERVGVHYVTRCEGPSVKLTEVDEPDDGDLKSLGLTKFEMACLLALHGLTARLSGVLLYALRKKQGLHVIEPTSYQRSTEYVVRDFPFPLVVKMYTDDETVTPILEIWYRFVRIREGEL